MDFDAYVKTAISLSEENENLHSLLLQLGTDSIQENWNSIFIETCSLFDIFPIIFEDTAFSRTSTNIEKQDQNINLYLLERISSFRKHSEKKFLLLLRRAVMDISVSGSRYNYYPIFVAIPYAFFKTGIIEKRLFNYDEQLIRIIETFFSGQDIPIFTFERIDSFTKITGVFSTGNVFAVQCEDVVISIDETQLKDYTELPIKSIVNPSLKNLLSFLVRYFNSIAVSLNITEVYKFAGKYVAVKINGKTFYICETKLPGIFQEFDYRETELNYNPVDIIAVAMESDSSNFEEKYFKINASRNDFTLYKEKFFKTATKKQIEELVKNPSAKAIDKILRGDFAEELATEFGDPVKAELFLHHSYIFESLFFNRNKSETIYLRTT